MQPELGAGDTFSCDEQNLQMSKFEIRRVGDQSSRIYDIYDSMFQSCKQSILVLLEVFEQLFEILRYSIQYTRERVRSTVFDTRCLPYLQNLDELLFIKEVLLLWSLCMLSMYYFS